MEVAVSNRYANGRIKRRRQSRDCGPRGSLADGVPDSFHVRGVVFGLGLWYNLVASIVTSQLLEER